MVTFWIATTICIIVLQIWILEHLMVMMEKLRFIHGCLFTLLGDERFGQIERVVYNSKACDNS